MPELRIPAIVFRQRNIHLYLFSISANKLEKLVRSNPKLSNNKEGIQRLLDKTRILSIARYVSLPETALPNNIIVNLTSDVRFEAGSIPGGGYLVFPSEDGYFGDILDGQHRLYGVVHNESTIKDLELPVTGVMLANPRLAAKIFADINNNQKPVSKVLLVSLQRELGVLPSAKDSAAAIVEQLNTDPRSPLQGRIQMFQDEKNTWLTNDKAISIIADLLHPSKTLYHMSVDNAVSLLIFYLCAVAATFPQAWGNNRAFRLTGPAGLQVIFGLFDRARERARAISSSNMPDEKAFVTAVEPLRDTQWDAETFKEQGFTSAGGRTRLQTALLIELTPPGANDNE